MADMAALLVSEVNKAMKRHGYTMASVAEPLDIDGAVLRFVVAGDNVLADRLKPIVISISGLDLLTTTDAVAFGKAKAAAAIEGGTGRP